jgi:hypothetical protein
MAIDERSPAGTSGSAPAPPARRHRRLVLVGAGALLVAYLGLLLLYAVSGRTLGVNGDAEPPLGGALIDIKVQGLDGGADRLTVDVDLSVDAALVRPDRLTLARPVTVVLDPSATTREIVFPAGRIPAVNPVAVVLDGDIRNWPLDDYSASLLVGAFDGSPESGTPLATAVRIGGRAQGWRVKVAPGPEIGETLGFLHSFTVNARRSGDILAFAVLMLLVLVTLPITALFVASRTYRGSRAIQPTFMSWMAAMLFATIPLRNFLPGNPPPGSWVDAVIVLWVIVGLVAALVIYVAAWWRAGRGGAP